MVTIELGRRIVIDQEVFLVIDGIPEKNDALECAIGMAPMRNYGNTAFMLNKGKWRPFTGYFQAAPGGQTSLSVFPYFSHSVLIPAEVDDKGAVTMGEDVTEVGAQAGTTDILVFANLGVYKYLGTNADWCRIQGTPGEYNVDAVTVEYDDLPGDMDEREALITVTDSIQTLDLVLRQTRDVTTAIDPSTINGHWSAVTGQYFDLQGRRITDARQARGIIIERRNGQVRKVLRR
jgi:hypothetical protein